MKKLIIIILLFFTSCSYKNWHKPMGRVFNTMPKGGTPGFNLGWIHGCESGLATQFGGEAYKMFYAWKKDPDIISSNPNFDIVRKRYKKELKDIDWQNKKEVEKNFSDYKKIHPIAYFQCRQIILGTMQSASMTPDLPGDNKLIQPFGHNVWNVLQIMGAPGDTLQGIW
jgi:hypothetical protein